MLTGPPPTCAAPLALTDPPTRAPPFCHRRSRLLLAGRALADDAHLPSFSGGGALQAIDEANPTPPSFSSPAPSAAAGAMPAPAAASSAATALLMETTTDATGR